MERNNPSLQPIKDRIDAGYSKFKIVQQASRNAGTHPDGTFTPAQLNRAVISRDRSKDKAAFARGDALMQDLATAAKDVLPSRVPDSGTPERLLTYDLGIGGGAGVMVSPHIPIALGLGALAYTKLGIAGINKMATAPATKNFLANLGRAAGPAGALAGDQAIPTIDVRPTPEQRTQVGQ